MLIVEVEFALAFVDPLFVAAAAAAANAICNIKSFELAAAAATCEMFGFR